MPTGPSSLWAFLLLLGLCPVLLRGDATSDLKKVEDEFFQWQLEQSPRLSTEVGSKQYNDRLADLSMDVLDSQRGDVQQFLNRTLSIDRRQLSRQNQYSYDVLVDMLSTFVNNYRWRYYGALNPISFLDAFYLDLDSVVNMTPFDTKKDFDDYIARLEAWPRQIAQMKDRMDQAIQKGTTHVNVSVIPVPGQISKVISMDPHDSPLYKPFNATLDAMAAISPQDREDLRTRGRAALQAMWTSLESLKTYMEKTYLPNTRATYGVHGLPDGKEYYLACLKWHLSVDTTPDEVHQKGLEEVDRITQLMRQVMTKQGFSGTISQYYDHLNNNQSFHLPSADAIINGYRDLIFNRINPKLPKFFKDIPPARIEVRPLSYDGPYGMYLSGSEDGSRPGIFYANLFRPNETKTYSMVSLTLHEAVPGHHLQSIYQLAAGLPDFRKYVDYYQGYSAPYYFPYYTAYVEGWALYAEFLGEEMKVYDNDYELMGRYGDEIFRACRLVVDTGLHYKGWSRERAVQYLAERTPMADKEVEIEIDRYLTWPGQACAYKIGELKIKELRQKATEDLGDKFDIRDFHSLLLNNGAVPLSLMETIVEDYIQEKKATGTASCLHSVSLRSVGIYPLLVLLAWTFTRH